MDIKIFTEMLRDKSFQDYKKMKYKYPADFTDFLEALKLYYSELPLRDSDGEGLVFIENHAAVSQSAVKLLLRGQSEYYGVKAVEEEIISTSAIESIDFSRESVRSILKGYAARDEQESRILGLKKGLEFIAEGSNKISEENLYRLYMMAVGDFAQESERLLPGNFYRHDTVYIVSDRIEHTGFPHEGLNACMKALIDFINREDGINDLVKAAVIHFYFACVHPYFNGNGRMARLLHLWFLIQRGYQSALFIPFSSRIEKSRRAYYNAFTQIEQNQRLSGKTDITPFIIYFNENVYSKMQDCASEDSLALYDGLLKSGAVTEKESRLWQFVLSCYGTEEFSTKRLERDFGDAAYATIRAFVLKFERLGLLCGVRYGTRVKYKMNNYNS